jgi:sulfite exporter TauE/SafE
LGAISGTIGSAIDLGGSQLGYARVAAVVAGAIMIVIGVITLARARGMKFGGIRLPAKLQQILQRGLNHARRRPPIARALIIGLMTGLLPCGWLYAFVIASAGTGSAALGGLTMLAFWAGTVPVMLTVGIGLQKFTGPLRRHVPVLSSIALLVAGVIAITGRLSAPAYADAIQPQISGESCTTAAQSISKLDSSEMPCCHGDH